MEGKGNHNEFLQFQISRNFLNLGKTFLFILQELEKDGKITKDEFITYRSKILGNTNDSIRYLFQIIDSLEIELKKT
jgi:hypothetical protein